MTSSQIAILSDIHGNRWALEAVLKDLEKRNINRIFNLGDTLYGPLDPEGTINLLNNIDIVSVCGNQDRIIFDMSIDDSENPTLKFVRGNLNHEDMIWLSEQKGIVSVDGQYLLFHGIPGNDEKYLVNRVTDYGITLRSNQALLEILKDYREPIFLCGHDHQPNVIRLPDGRMIINPGSVGLQAYNDDLPVFHHVENGNPNARYAIVTEDERGVNIDQCALPYDHFTAAITAESNGRHDWASWLRTGRI